MYIFAHFKSVIVYANLYLYYKLTISINCSNFSNYWNCGAAYNVITCM